MRIKANLPNVWNKSIVCDVKKLLATAFAFIILAGCATTDRSNPPVVTADITLEEAFDVLVDDCFSTASGYGDFTTSDMAGLLDVSVQAYEDYLPLYDVLLDSYLKELVELAEESSEWGLDTLRKMDIALPGDLLPYVGDMMIMGYVAEKTRAQMAIMLTSHIASEMGPADEKWNSFATECGIIKANYDNLNQLGFVLQLPDPSPVGASQISALVLERMYSALAEAETYLKNRPLSENDNEAYYIFWQEV